MQPVIYRRTLAELQSEKNRLWFSSSCWTTFSLLSLPGLLWATGSPLTLLFVIGSFLAAISIVGFIRYARHGKPADNFLRLDDAGVTQGILGKAHHWPWSELSGLSDFEPRGSGKSRFLPGCRHIPIAKRDETGWRRLLPRWGREPTIIVEEYGAPLDEIAAKLNDYRAEALAAAPGGN